MARTKIDWTDETINPFTGCRNKCGFCYARRMAHRLAHIRGTVYERVDLATASVDPETGISDGGGDPFRPAVHIDVLDREERRLMHARIRRGQPRRVFVGSMGDICYERLAVTFAASGGLLPMAVWWTSRKLQIRMAQFAQRVAPDTILMLTKRPDLLAREVNWPQNVHMGVSVTGNEDSDKIATLHRWYGHADADTPWNEQKPGVLWASVEPLLDADFDPNCLAGLDWVVVGVQTGPGVSRDGRTRSVGVTEAAGRIVWWCYENGVPCFTKDNLRRLPESDMDRPPKEWPRQLPEGFTR